MPDISNVGRLGRNLRANYLNMLVSRCVFGTTSEYFFLFPGDDFLAVCDYRPGLWMGFKRPEIVQRGVDVAGL
jgi:hypothetical protein